MKEPKFVAQNVACQVGDFAFSVSDTFVDSKSIATFEVACQVDFAFCNIDKHLDENNGRVHTVHQSTFCDIQEIPEIKQPSNTNSEPNVTSNNIEEMATVEKSSGESVNDIIEFSCEPASEKCAENTLRFENSNTFCEIERACDENTGTILHTKFSIDTKSKFEKFDQCICEIPDLILVTDERNDPPDIILLKEERNDPPDKYML